MEAVKRVIAGEHPAIPSVEEWGAVSTVMLKCFALKPENRPSFEDICKELGNNMKTKVLHDNEEVDEEIAYNSENGNFYKL